MSGFSEDAERRLVPRWRFTRDLIHAAEVAGDTSSFNQFDPNPRFLEEKLADWEECHSVATAAEAVVCGVTTGRPDKVREPAQFILRNNKALAPSVCSFAEAAFGSPPQEEPYVENELPFLSITAERARTEARLARARLKRDPLNLLAYLDMSRAHAILGQRRQSLSAIETALIVNPSHRHTLRVAARLFVHVGEPDRALRLLLSNPRTLEDPWLFASAIAIATLMGRAPRHIRRARELIVRQRHSPEDLSELNGALGTLDFYSGDVRGARRSFRASLIAPTDNALAQARWVGRRLTGIEIGEPAWNVPRSFEAWCWRALDEGHWLAASQYCTQWIQDEPFSSRPAVVGSYIGLSLMPNASLSESCAKVGLQADPSDQALLNNLTVALAYQGKLDEAEHSFARISREPTGGYPTYVYLATAGLLKFRRRNIHEGRDLYRQAAQSAPRDKRARVLIYWTREEMLAATDYAPVIYKEMVNEAGKAMDPQTTRLLEAYFNPSELHLRAS